MVNVRTSPVARNLLATVEQLSLYPLRTVADALTRLNLPLAGVPRDMLTLAGSEACEAIEAEALVLQEGWAA